MIQKKFQKVRHEISSKKYYIYVFYSMSGLNINEIISDLCFGRTYKLMAKYYLNNISKPWHAVKILKLITKEGCICQDSIMDKLCNYYLSNLPTQEYMARLSVLYQSVESTNGMEEYSLLTLLNCANISIIENEKREKDKK